MLKISGILEKPVYVGLSMMPEYKAILDFEDIEHVKLHVSTPESNLFFSRPVFSMEDWQNMAPNILNVLHAYYREKKLNQ